MGRYDPATLKQKDKGELFLVGLLAFAVVYAVTSTAGLLLLPPVGKWSEEPFTLTYQETLTCAFHVPLMITETARGCDRLLAQTGISKAFGLRLSIAAVIALTAAVSVSGRMVRKRDKLIHIRGNERLDDADAEKYLQTFTAKECRSDKHSLQALPWLNVSRRRQGEHFASLGGTGSGKTQTLLRILVPAYNRRDKLLIHCNKGDFTSWIGDALLLAPGDARSAIWDIGKDVCTLPAAREFAGHIIPPGKGDPIWHEGAQQMLVGYLLSLFDRYDDAWGWLELAQISTLRAEDWYELLDEYYEEALEYVEKPESNLSLGLRAELKAHFALIGDLANAWGMDTDGRQKVSLKDWLLDDDTPHRTIILQYNQEIKKLSSQWIGTVFNMLAPLAVSPRRKKTFKSPVWFFLDELAELSKQEHINSLINLGREKGIYLYIGAQTLSSLNAIYTADVVENWLNSIGTLFLARHGRGGGADKSAALAGRRQVERPDVSAGYNKKTDNQSDNFSYRGEMQQVIIPSEMSSDLGFEEKPFLHVKVLALGFGEKALMVRFPISVPKEKREPFVEAPWMKKGRYQKVRNPELEARRKQRLAEAEAKKAEKEERAQKKQAMLEAEVTENLVSQTTEKVLERMSEAVGGQGQNNSPGAEHQVSNSDVVEQDSSVKATENEVVVSVVTADIIPAAAAHDKNAANQQTIENYVERIQKPFAAATLPAGAKKIIRRKKLVYKKRAGE